MRIETRIKKDKQKEAERYAEVIFCLECNNYKHRKSGRIFPAPKYVTVTEEVCLSCKENLYYEMCGE